WFTLIGFFASFCRALPFPHSFPTRRSSDLVGVVALGEVGAVMGAAALLALDAAAGDDLGEDEHVAQGAGEAEGLVGPAGGVAEADPVVAVLEFGEFGEALLHAGAVLDDGAGGGHLLAEFEGDLVGVGGVVVGVSGGGGVQEPAGLVGLAGDGVVEEGLREGGRG